MYSILKTFSWLLWRDIREVKKALVNKVIDSIIWPVSTVLVSAFVLTKMGMPSGYGIFMLIGCIVAICIWDSSADASALSTDLSGEKKISYELTLPLTYWLVYLRVALTFAVKAMAFNFITLPIGLLFVPTEFHLLHFSLIKFVIAYIASNIFIGAFTTYTVIITKNVTSFNSFWMRYGSLLFSFSGFQFSWTTLSKIYPTLAKINLLNPFVYTFESLRNATMGPSDTIGFGYCILALTSFSFIFLYIGIKTFKKRLDCI